MCDCMENIGWCLWELGCCRCKGCKRLTPTSLRVPEVSLYHSILWIPNIFFFMVAWCYDLILVKLVFTYLLLYLILSHKVIAYLVVGICFKKDIWDKVWKNRRRKRWIIRYIDLLISLQISFSGSGWINDKTICLFNSLSVHLTRLCTYLWMVNIKSKRSEEYRV